MLLDFGFKLWLNNMDKITPTYCYAQLSDPALSKVTSWSPIQDHEMANFSTFHGEYEVFFLSHVNKYFTCTTAREYKSYRGELETSNFWLC